MRRRIFPLFAFAICMVAQQHLMGQSEVMEKLRKSDLARRSFVLYPSTIRMVNVAKLPSYYETVRNIEKAIFFPLREKFTAHDFLNTLAKLQDDEGFEELLEFKSSEGDELLILHHEKFEETVFLSQRGSRYYMGSLFGKIDLLKLLDLQKDLQDPEVIASNPLLQQLQKSGFGRKREDRHKEENEEENQSKEKKSTT